MAGIRLADTVDVGWYCTVLTEPLNAFLDIPRRNDF